MKFLRDPLPENGEIPSAGRSPPGAHDEFERILRALLFEGQYRAGPLTGCAGGLDRKRRLLEIEATV
jgi:hypothetical protein